MHESPPQSADVRERSTTGPADPLVGRVLNERFKVLSLIAKGGMGRVYRAEQMPLGRHVALKVLHVSYEGLREEEFRHRFFLEAATCAKLGHPNTITVFDYGHTEDHIYWIAMELLDGRTLQRTIREEGAFAPERAVRIGRQIARSLRDAHEAGLIHRDLKSANIFLLRRDDEQDFVKVLDFGLVKDLEAGHEITQTGLFMGSPKYMSPEQAKGEKLDPRTDVYSLGVILYEMLAGKVPFEGPNATQIMLAQVGEPVPTMHQRNPAIVPPPGLEAIVMRCLEKSRDARFGSMRELVDALDAWASEQRIVLSPSLPPGSADASQQRAAVTAHGSGSGVLDTSSLVSQSVPVTRRSIAAIVLGMAAIMGLGALGALAVVHRTSGASNEHEVAVPSPLDTNAVPNTTARVGTSAETSPPVPTVLVAQPRAMRVHLDSTPQGATVEVMGVTYGPTPVEIEWPTDRAPIGTELTFRFRRPGFRDAVVPHRVESDAFAVSAALEAQHARPRVVGAPTSSAAQTAPGAPDDLEPPPRNPYRQ